MEESQKYKCPYCGIEHPNPREMALCIIRCEEKRKEEEEYKRKEQLRAEKTGRAQQVKEAYDHYKELYNAYYKDYGEVISSEPLAGLMNLLWQ